MTAAFARLFVATDPPDPVRERLGTIARGLAGAKWTRPGQLHVTLRFLGSIPADAVPSVADRLRRVQFPSFELAARGFGAFPSLRSPRVVWVGLFPAAPLEALHEAVERKLEGAAPPDGKRFSPHLTIARLDGTPGPAVREWIAAREPFATEEWTAAAFSLYASTLAPSGAIHRELERYPLEPASRTRE